MNPISQWLIENHDWLESLSFIAVAGGIPLALTEFYRKTRKEINAREYGTYNALDEKYLEFQHLCLTNPELDIFDIPDRTPSQPSPLRKKQELIAFTILFSVFERAFLMYSEQSRTVRREQWQGWADYIASYCKRENFCAAWDISGKTFDDRFQSYMKAVFEGKAPDLCAYSWWEWRPWHTIPKAKKTAGSTASSL